MRDTRIRPTITRAGSAHGNRPAAAEETTGARSRAALAPATVLFGIADVTRSRIREMPLLGSDKGISLIPSDKGISLMRASHTSLAARRCRPCAPPSPRPTRRPGRRLVARALPPHWLLASGDGGWLRRALRPRVAPAMTCAHAHARVCACVVGWGRGQTDANSVGPFMVLGARVWSGGGQDFDVLKECTWAVANAVVTGDDSHIAYLVQHVRPLHPGARCEVEARGGLLQSCEARMRGRGSRGAAAVL